MDKYRILKEGEIVQHGDEVDDCRDGWRDAPQWVDAAEDVGRAAPDPQFPSHRKFRRRLDS